MTASSAPATVVVDEEVPGRADDVLARLDVWLVAGHHLRRDRLRDGRGEWSKRTGVVGRGDPRRSAASSGKASSATCTASWPWPRDTGTGTCVVRIEADRRHDRAVRATTGALVAAAGTAGVVVAAVVAGPVLLVVAPVTVVAGVGVAATGRGRASRVGREVDRVLDAVDQQVRPARLGVDVVRRVAGRRGGCEAQAPAASRRRTSGWSRPLVLMAVSLSWVATPWRSVNVPPASSTRRRTAAMS